MSQHVYRLVNRTRGTVVAECIRRADTFWQRATGLLTRRKLTRGEGLWLIPCNGVHTFFLRFSIDLLILNRDLQVVRAFHNVPPFRICWPVRGGYSTVELATGTLASAGVQQGDWLALENRLEAR